MRLAKLIISCILGTAGAIYTTTTSDIPADPLTVVVGFPIVALMFSFAVWLFITVVPFIFGFALHSPGRPPARPTRRRASLPYNSSNDPRRW